MINDAIVHEVLPPAGLGYLDSVRLLQLLVLFVIVHRCMYKVT